MYSVEGLSTFFCFPVLTRFGDAFLFLVIHIEWAIVVRFSDVRWNFFMTPAGRCSTSAAPAFQEVPTAPLTQKAYPVDLEGDVWFILVADEYVEKRSFYLCLVTTLQQLRPSTWLRSVPIASTDALTQSSTNRYSNPGYAKCSITPKQGRDVLLRAFVLPYVDLAWLSIRRFQASSQLTTWERLRLLRHALNHWDPFSTWWSALSGGYHQSGDPPACKNKPYPERHE